MANTLTITEKNITKETFLQEMEEIKPLIEGRYKDVAKITGIAWNTYKYYAYGESGDTDEARSKMWIIYKAALKIAAEQRDKYLTSISHLDRVEAHIS